MSGRPHNQVFLNQDTHAIVSQLATELGRGVPETVEHLVRLGALWAGAVQDGGIVRVTYFGAGAAMPSVKGVKKGEKLRRIRDILIDA